MKTYSLTKDDLALIKMAKSLAREDKVVGGKIREVGCALITKDGKIFTGANWDLFCGLGFCAESSAISNMVAHSDETEIGTIVACSKTKVMPPCGRCREVMNMLDKKNHKNTFVIISEKEKVKLDDLLPANWLKVEGKL